MSQKQPRKRRSETSDDTVGLRGEKLLRSDDSDRNKLRQLLFGGFSQLLVDSEEALERSDEPGTCSVESGIESGHSEDSDTQESVRKPVWSDDEDEGIQVGAALNAQHRKLPSGGANDRSNNYTNLLKQKFESAVGTPAWAKLDRQGLDSDEEILRSVGFVHKIPKSTLPSGSLEFKKVRDLNCETYSEGPFINSIEFHPTSSVGLVAGNKGVATLFAVDGKKNSKLHSVAFERFPIFCAKFIRHGDEVVLGSRQGHIYIYDLMGAKALRYNLPPNVTQAKNFVASPDSQFIAIAGKWGEVHILSSVSKERIACLKQDNEVTALEYNASGNLLFGHSDAGEVTIWDINMRRVQHKFIDEGCLQGTTLAASSSNQFIACGSAQGVVNLYGMDDVLQHKLPKPRKTIMNLTTAIRELKFNSTSEVVAFCSSDIKNSVKLFHLGSGGVFNNFPLFQSKLGHLNCINFTPGSGYLALGNQKSVVNLFRLKHFKNY